VQAIGDDGGVRPPFVELDDFAAGAASRSSEFSDDDVPSVVARSFDTEDRMIADSAVRFWIDPREGTRQLAENRTVVSDDLRAIVYHNDGLNVSAGPLRPSATSSAGISSCESGTCQRMSSQEDRSNR
jgi:hypothetical protein